MKTNAPETLGNLMAAWYGILTWEEKNALLMKRLFRDYITPAMVDFTKSLMARDSLYERMRWGEEVVSKIWKDDGG